VRQGKQGGRAIAGALTVLVFACLTSHAAAAPLIVTTQDRIATHAYLQALYAYDQAQLTNVKASQTAVESIGDRLTQECPGVLAKAPQPEEALVAKLSGHPLSPNARGVAGRHARQLADLGEEISLAESQAGLGPLRSAAATFAHRLRELQWSEPELTTYEHTGAEEIEWVLDAPPPDVCADMRLWVGSGYLSLPPATREIESEGAPIQESLDLVLFDPTPHLSMSQFGAPYDRVLTRRIAHLEQALKHPRETTRTIQTRIEGTLGLISAKQVEEQEGIPQGSVLIANGRTPPNRTYAVWVEPKRSQSPTGCVRLLIQEEVRASAGTITSSSEECVSREHPQALRVECTPPNEITISAQLPNRVRRVVLTLSDGRQLSTAVAHVPARLGGPFSFYYMILRARRPIPVSLREIGAGNQIPRTVKLHVTGYCRQPNPSTEHVVQVTRELAAGRLAGGPVYALIGERSGNSQKVQIQLRVPHPAQRPLLGSFEEPDQITAPQHPHRPKPYIWNLATGCQPHPYAILFGLLRDPADTVQARTAQGLVTLKRTPLPPALHTSGVLAYAALTEIPTEIVIDGRALRVESLASKAREAKELCEGEAEPPV
jgi:hypothetical protein